jgi:hypothetical protein
MGRASHGQRAPHPRSRAAAAVGLATAALIALSACAWRRGRRKATFGDFFQGYVNDHPPDELARLTVGRNLGWPFSDPDPDRQPGRLGSPVDYANMRFDSDPQANPGG